MGALIATFAHNPVLALPLALASHFAMDTLPHFDYPNKKGDHANLQFFIWLAADCAVAASILTALLVLQPAYIGLILACAVAAASPDLMWLYYLVLKRGPAQSQRPALVRFHAAIQKHTAVHLWPAELAWLLVTGSLLASRLS